MPTSQQTYLLTESVIGSVISLALSILFVFLVFDTDLAVPVFGMNGIIVDALPQSLAIAFMATLMPTLLTRKRMKTGKINVIDGRVSHLPYNMVLRSLMVAAVVVIFALVLHFSIFSALGGSTFSFTFVLFFKACYGALLGAAVSYYSLLNALSAKA